MGVIGSSQQARREFAKKRSELAALTKKGVLINIEQRDRKYQFGTFQSRL